MKSMDDELKFMMLVLYNDMLAGVNYQSFKVKGYKQNVVLINHKFECISCKHSHVIDTFARAKLEGLWELPSDQFLPEIVQKKIVDI